ncbi:hypothetical protein H9Q69_008635 [Fusarium xylarioides]|uniref:Uncharacterized protein n=1 Tax=Fusarium xylarioides TaxID=221167 RepID=A0A9P7L5F5_9HYPO|nr:hypothetical protein H9Q70_001732 [Fusarium xylarioides]KAG5764333.1 hypothetical protein H9Q72_007583 [Fusarium xylarioides]KAG5784677.1 hypothetical protein H9Q73_001659 [Fusarium xylarioides]KAG5792315.1 hypothetical protein H9Q69_008635 [Fusarium xylarioides]KAG5813687.1 hypothetical protein H9Q71_003639 [Fusarium xylarioides]
MSARVCHLKKENAQENAAHKAQEDDPDKEKSKREKLESQTQANHARLDEIAENGEDKDQISRSNSMITEGLVEADARPAYRHDLSKFVEVSFHGQRSAN